jgi:hypothetical protein
VLGPSCPEFDYWSSTLDPAKSRLSLKRHRRKERLPQTSFVFCNSSLRIFRYNHTTMIDHICSEFFMRIGDGLADCLVQCVCRLICEPYIRGLCYKKKTKPEGMSTTHLARLELTRFYLIDREEPEAAGEDGPLLEQPNYRTFMTANKPSSNAISSEDSPN